MYQMVGIVLSVRDHVGAKTRRHPVVRPIEAGRALCHQVAQRWLQPGDGADVADAAEDDQCAGFGQRGDELVQPSLEHANADSVDHIVGADRDQEDVGIEGDGRPQLVAKQIVGA